MGLILAGCEASGVGELGDWSVVVMMSGKNAGVFGTTRLGAGAWRLALGVAAAGVLAGCQAGGGGTNSPSAAPPMLAKPAKPASNPGDHYEAMAALGYRPQWNALATVTRGRTMAFFSAYPDILVAHESGNSISVLEASTGASRWRLDLAGPVTKFLGNIRDRRNDDILSMSETEVFVLDSRTGGLKDRQPLATISNTPPAQFGNILVYGCPTGEVQGHNLSSGFKQWGYQLEGAITVSPAPIGGAVAVVSERGEVAILDPLSGSSLGRARIFHGPRSQPAATTTTLFIASTDQSIWAFGAEGGEPLWRVRTERALTGQPVVHQGVVFVPVPDLGLSAYQAGTGEHLWSATGVSGSVIAVRRGRLIVREQDEALAIDPLTGQILERAAMKGVWRMVPDAFVDGNMYLVEPRGRVQKFSPR